MALILRPERWLAKPPAGTPLDRSHPLANNLRLYIPFTEGGGAARDVVSGRLAYVPNGTNSAWGVRPGGMALITVGANLTTSLGGSGALAADPQWQIAAPLTVLCDFHNRTAAFDNANLFGTANGATNGGNSGYTLYEASAGSTHHVFLSGPTSVDLSIGVLTAGRRHQVAIVYDGATAKFYADGILKASSAHTGAIVYPTTGFQVGQEGDNGTGSDTLTDAYALGIWGRALSGAEVEQMWATPYTLLAPPTPSHRFFVVGVGTPTSALVGTASSATAASAVLTQTPVAAQNLVGTASSATAASAALTLTPAASQALIGSAAADTAASGALSQTAAPAQALVGSAASATAASAILTETSVAAQALVGSASSQTSASGTFTSGTTALNLVGTAASASAAAAALTIAAAAAQNIVGSASSGTAASGVLTLTPVAAQHLVGTAASATSANASLGTETANFQIGVNNAGTGGNDMSPAAVRDSSNRLWRAAVTSGTSAFDNSTGQYNNNTLRMFRCTTTGVPTAFAEQDSAHRPTNVGSFSIAIDGSDTIHVAFVHTYAASTTGIYYTTFNTTTNLWSGVETKIGTANYATTATYLPGDAGVSMALDASGVPHVVSYGQVSGTGATHIFYTNKVGGTWSAAVQLDTATLSANQRCMHPQCMFDSTGALHAVWMTITFNYGTTLEHCFYIKRSSGGTWGSVTQFTDNLLGSLDNGPALYVSEDDHIHIAYGLGDGSNPSGQAVTGTTVNNSVFYRFSSDGGVTWNTTTQPPHYVSHDFALGPSGDDVGGVRIYVHIQPTTVDGLGTAIGYMQLPKGGSWAAWTQIANDATGDGFDCTVSPRRETFFHNGVRYLDTAYTDANLPVSAMLSSDPSGLIAAPMVATAQSATAASAVLTLTPAAPQPLVGGALSQSAAAATLTETPAAAQNLVGSAASATAASAAITIAAAAAQPLIGSAASQSSASGTLTQSGGVAQHLTGTAASTTAAVATLTETPPAPQPLIGTAASASSASGALTLTNPSGVLSGTAASATSAQGALTLTAPPARALVGGAAAATAATAALTMGTPPPLLLTGTAMSRSAASGTLTNGTGIVYGTVTLTTQALTTITLTTQAIATIALTVTDEEGVIMDSYVVGNVAHLNAIIRDITGVNVDAGTVTVSAKPPKGVIFTPVAATHGATGVYTYDYDVDLPGTHAVRVETVNPKASAQCEIYGVPSLVA